MSLGSACRSAARPLQRFALLLIGCLSPLIGGGELRLHRLFQDHQVLQRDAPIAVYGTGPEGETVGVALAGVNAAGVVGADGRWRVELPAQGAGGPHVLTATAGGYRVSVSDILIGDVWLASGQSNMGYRVREGVTDGGDIKGTAHRPRIRQFEVPQLPAGAPVSDLGGGTWVVCGPSTVDQFSAVAYFFARSLEEATGIPIGILHASWGGSSIEAWLRPGVLSSLPHLAGPEIDLARAGVESLTALHAVNEANVRLIHERIAAVTTGLEQGVHRPGFDDAAWAVGPVPRWMQLEQRIYWLRRVVDWPVDAAGPVFGSLGNPGGSLHVFLDGEPVELGKGGPGRFEVPPRALKAGRHVIAVRIGNPWFPPFFEGGADQFFLRDEATGHGVSLVDEWRREGSIEPALPPYYSLQEVPSALFNGMISPLLGYGLAGVIWYQGENNTRNAEQYRRLFPALIGDWRSLIDRPNLPFLFVQLANYGERSELPEGVAGWPLLRAAQAEALRLPGTGMAVAIDVGDRYDIHPKEKAAVGQRLARLALAAHYGQPVEARGPVFRSADFRDGGVTLRFDHARGLRTRSGGRPVGFAVAGEDRFFHPADARIENETVILSSAAVPRPVAVRYGWAKNPVTSLYNAADLPAEPFRTDDWEGSGGQKKRPD